MQESEKKETLLFLATFIKKKSEFQSSNPPIPTHSPPRQKGELFAGFSWVHMPSVDQVSYEIEVEEEEEDESDSSQDLEDEISRASLQLTRQGYLPDVQQ